MPRMNMKGNIFVGKQGKNFQSFPVKTEHVKVWAFFQVLALEAILCTTFPFQKGINLSFCLWWKDGKTRGLQL